MIDGFVMDGDGGDGGVGGNFWNFQVKWSIEVPSPVLVHRDTKSAKDIAYNPIILFNMNKPNTSSTLTLSITKLVNLFWKFLSYVKSENNPDDIFTKATSASFLNVSCLLFMAILSTCSFQLTGGNCLCTTLALMYPVIHVCNLYVTLHLL